MPLHLRNTQTLPLLALPQLTCRRAATLTEAGPLHESDDCPAAHQASRERHEKVLQEHGEAAHAGGGSGGAVKGITNREELLHLSALCTQTSSLSMEQVIIKPAQDKTPVLGSGCQAARHPCSVISQFGFIVLPSCSCQIPACVMHR